MKKIYLLIVVLTFFSCQESKKEITGFGGFNIGSDLSTHEKFADFRNTMPDEYFCNSMQLSEAIGMVSNINITTEYGKITEVKFSTNEKTNIDEIQNQLNTKAKYWKDLKFQDDTGIFKAYTTSNDDIIFVDFESKNELNKNGKAKHEFSYSNRNEIENNNKLVKSFLNRKNY